MITSEQVLNFYNTYIDMHKKKWRKIYLDHGRFSSVWNAGQDFSNITKYPGAYSKSEWERLGAMFPESIRGNYLHLFSGGLPSGNYYRIDSKGFPDKKTKKDFIINAEELSKHIPENSMDLIFADPPWNKHHAENTYKMSYVNKRKVALECHKVLKPGGILVWKDAISLPRKRENWHYMGVIFVDPSSGHMDRSFRFFRKQILAGDTTNE